MAYTVQCTVTSVWVDWSLAGAEDRSLRVGVVWSRREGRVNCRRERESLNLPSAAVEQTCLWLGCLGDGGVGLCGGRGLMGGGGARELSLRAGHQRPPSPAVTLFALVLLFTIEQTFAHHMLQVRNIMCTC